MKALKQDPIQISKDIFKQYYYCCIEQKNSGVIIDDGLFEFLFTKEKDIQVVSNGKKIALPQVCGIGKVEKPSRLLIPSKVTYFTIKIQPWAASFFFSKNQASIIDLSETLYPDIDVLHDKIFTSNSFAEQIEYVEDFFLAQELPDLQTLEISKEICNYIYEKNGNIVIKDLLDKFPHSRQKLNQLFFDQTKNSIKEFAIQTRLRAIMAYHVNHPEETLTNITYKFGYFDQSHFIRDMKKITGITPAKFSNTSNLFFEQLTKS